MNGNQNRANYRYVPLLCFVCLLSALSGCTQMFSRHASPAGQLADAIDLSSGWVLQDIAKVSAPGETLSNVGYHPRDWYPATVPGTVLTSLVNNGVYPEPLYGENNRPEIIPESLCRTSYWYRNEFTVPAKRDGQHTWLNFDGINFTAEVWVNSERLGEIKGAFSRGIFDISQIVKPGEKAAVAVLIKPPLNPANPVEQTVQNGLGLNGGIHSHDGPTFISTQGWDWIPGIRDRDMGIWQKVTVSATGPVVIEDPYVVTDLPLPRTDSAEVTIEATVRNVSSASASGALHGTLGDIPFQSGQWVLQPNETQRAKFKVNISKPKLWWPNGFGEPNLYPLHLSFDIGRIASDSKSLNVGIREITYALPDSDNLAIVVNGVPVFAKGGNWGMDEAMKRIPRERLEAQIRFHKEANYTFIRNWVGQSTSEDFYDLCDQYGILIWDEFFQPNPSDSGRAPTGRGARGPASTNATAGATTRRAVGDDDISDVPMYLANVREKVLRFRNHPSIALWCGRNEGVPTPASINEGNAAILKELNPDRLYQASSTDGRGVRSGGPYSWRPPQAYYADGGGRGGNAGGRGRGAASSQAASAPATPPATPVAAAPNLSPFKTELGAVSIPTLESIKGMMPEKDWNPVPLNDDWASHDLARGANNGNTYPQTIATRYGPFNGLPEFVRKAQLANYEAHRALYEGRLAQMFHPSNAVFLWMSNPSQPSFTWQIYSYDLEPFASLFGAKKACEPVHIQMNQNNSHLMVVNNRAQALGGLIANVRVFNLDGTLKHEHQTPLDAKGSAVADLGLIEFPADLSQVHFVKLELRDAKQKLISDNFYWRGVQADDLTALDTIGTASLDTKIVRRDSQGKCLLDVTISNPSKVVAVMTHLQLRKEKSNVRVLPVYYTDNYISLLPGETRTITIEASTKDLGNEHPMVAVDGWNVSVKNASFGSASIRLNEEAMPKQQVVQR